MAARLHQIDEARRYAAQARLAAAAASFHAAREQGRHAHEALESAEAEWRSHLESGAFTVELGRALGAELLAREAALGVAEDAESIADRKLAVARDSWRAAEVTAKAAEAALRGSRRKLQMQTEAVRDQELADRMTWKWFAR